MHQARYDTYDKPSSSGQQRQNTIPQMNKELEYNKPLSANRKDRNKASNMDYGEPETKESYGNFGDFGNNTTQLKIQKNKKRNDFVSSLEEQIKLKNERQRREKEEDASYGYEPSNQPGHQVNQSRPQFDYQPQPSSAHSRRGQQSYQPEVSEDIYENKPKSRDNTMPGFDNQ